MGRQMHAREGGRESGEEKVKAITLNESYHHIPIIPLHRLGLSTRIRRVGGT